MDFSTADVTTGLPAQPAGCRSLIIVFVIVVILMAAFIAIIAKILRDLEQQ